MRYYQSYSTRAFSWGGYVVTGTVVMTAIDFGVIMRATPTCTYTDSVTPANFPRCRLATPK